MNILKVAVSCAIVAASFGTMAQNGAPVKLTTYSAYTESFWGVSITLKPGGKAVMAYVTHDEDKPKRTITSGTWAQDGDTVTTKFKKSTFVYKIQEHNSDPSFSCKGPYGLKPIVKREGDDVANQYLWPDKLIGENGPCVK